MEAEFLVDRPHPVMKINIHNFDHYIQILDTAGVASIIGLHDRRVKKKNKCCTEIFENKRLYSRSIVREEEQGGLLKLKTAIYGEI